MRATCNPIEVVNMNKKIIQFDVDGVLADFILAFTMRGNEMYGTPISQSNDQPYWDGFPGMTKKHISGVWDSINNDDGFWSSMRCLVSIPTMLRINALVTQHDVYFVTARRTRNAKRRTQGWLEHHGIYNPTVIISPAKGEVARALEVTHAIDDKAGNAICVQHLSEAQSYIIDRKYNQFPHDTVGTKVKRVKTVEEFLDDLERINIEKGTSTA